MSGESLDGSSWQIRSANHDIWRELARQVVHRLNEAASLLSVEVAFPAEELLSGWFSSAEAGG
jgi:hypothetical protein